MMKQRWGLDRNVLRPTPGDPWGVEQYHWNTGAEENQQLNPGGPSNRQKSSTSAQGIYYVSKFSSSAFAHRTICDLKFLSLAQYTVTWISAVPLPQKKDVIWNSALLLLHVNITFLWKIHSHSTTHPFLNFCDVLHDWWTLWRTEKQSNREAPGKRRR